MNPKQKKNKEYQFPTNSMMVDEILKIIDWSQPDPTFRIM
jgi:hypothetical protein